MRTSPRSLTTPTRILATTVLVLSSATAAMADDNVLSTSVADGVTRLSLAGAPFHTSERSIVNQRIVAVGEAAVVTWQERGGDNALHSYFAISRDGRTVDRVAQTENTIRLRYGTFDPLEFVPGVDPVARARAGSDVCIVQFISQPLEQYREDIRAWGGTIERYLADNAHIVRMSPQRRAEVASLPYVRWVGDFHPAYKLDEPILQAITLGSEGTDFAAPRRYSIMTLREGDGSLDPVVARIEAMGGRVDLTSAATGRLEATVTLRQLLEVARMNEVLFIDAWGPVAPDMDIVRMYHGTDYVEGLTGFSGEGVRGEVLDIGFDLEHPEFSHQDILVHGSLGSPATHGTAVAGILFAQGLDPKARGIIPDAQMIVADRFHSDRYTATGELVDPAGPYRAVFQNSSVGSPRTSDYTTISAELDRILFDHDLALCQSHSDSGAPIARPEAWAKNVISVGGFIHNDTLTRLDDRHGSLASTGPATDGRVKPDLSSFYDHVYTVGSASGTEFGGTSAATAITCGHLGLLHQMWHEGVFPGYPRGGPGATVFDSRPHMTTAKAMLINTAQAYEIGFADFTRYNQGWGPPDLRRLYDDREQFFIVDQEHVLQNQDIRRYDIAVARNAPLKVTLVYPDPPGTVASVRHRINDLSLKITSPAGDVYWGNAGLLEGDWSVAGGVESDIDTVENVFLEDPAPGAWRVEVIASEINEDGHPATPEVDAVYSLVINGAGVDFCYADCDGSGELDFFDFLCFQDEFATGAASADCDDSGELDFFDFLCFQNEFAAGCL